MPDWLGIAAWRHWRWLLPAAGFCAGVASFVLVERAEWLAQYVMQSAHFVEVALLGGGDGVFNFLLILWVLNLFFHARWCFEYFCS